MPCNIPSSWDVSLLRQGARGTSLLCRTMAVIAFNPPTSKAESFLIIASNLNLIHYIAVVLVLYVYTFGIVFSLRPNTHAGFCAPTQPLDLAALSPSNCRGRLTKGEKANGLREIRAMATYD